MVLLHIAPYNILAMFTGSATNMEVIYFREV
jgi:hypothetical protein